MQEQRKKLFSYAIIMLIAAIIIILIAYMSENRADMYENQLTKSESAVASVQAELVRLTNENFELKKQNEKNITAASDFENFRVTLDIIKSAWQLHSVGDSEGAVNKLSEVDRTNLDDTAGAFYDSVYSQITAE